MSEETKVTTETASEETTTETTQDSSNERLIAESKKYRKRAQEAEAEASALRKKIDLAKQSELKEKEEWKTLYEEQAQKVESLTSDAEQWKSYKESRKSTLLESFPEDRRAEMAKVPLKQLELVIEEIKKAKPNAPEVAGNPRKKEPTKKLSQLTQEEKRENWQQILNSYKP